MFKKTMKFDNLHGEEVTQTFYFNYNKKEIAELLEFGAIQKFAKPGEVKLPLEQMMEKLTKSREEQGLSQQENNQQAYNIFQDLVLDAFGKKGDDDVTFEKNWELRNYFESHVAFVELIFEFLGNERLAAEFIESCLPPRLVAQAKDELAQKQQVPAGTLADMVEEAERRQQDPATRVEPGPEAAAAALVDESAKKIEDLTEEDILAMDDVAFNKLDTQRLSKEQLVAAFRRKMQTQS